MMKRMTFLAVALAGCSSASTPTSVLLADTNRDGVVDDSDRAGKADWSATGGAIFLANVDDDDADGTADSSDEKVNGPGDEPDLARIKLVPWPGAPATATATLTVDGDMAADSDRVFRNDGGTWTVVGATLSAADLVAGLEFGIEAKNFVQSTAAGNWNGYASLHLVITDGGKSVVDDQVKLRVAPYVMINNLSTISDVWQDPPGDAAGDAFHQDMITFTTAANAMLDDSDPPATQGLDQWDEDWWQVGVTFMPGPNGTTQFMRVGQRSAQPDREAGGFAATQLAPGFGFIWPHGPGAHGQSDQKGYSLDSFGDHDTLPPYTNGADSYPLGRIIVGGNTKSHIDPVVRAFYDAQAAQLPIQVDTTFLLVGHIDEIMSYVPANTPRGWKLLVAKPALARSMLMDLVSAGHGDATMFTGKFFFNEQTSTLSIPAQTTVAGILADTEIMAASDAAATFIDAALAAVQTGTGLTADEIIEVPILFERSDSGGVGFEYVAHSPGTVNLRVANGNVGIPKPYGPMLSTGDAFEADLIDRLGAKNSLGVDGKGLKVTFVEDWDDYHALDGEVHCASTTMVSSMPNVKWWEAGR